VEFVDTNAHLPIGLAEITGAARISARGLQYLFARHRGQTPLQYLREVRMAHAHRELMAADPTRGDTVAAVAARWGFAHAGRFSAQYRQVYGRSPGATLRE
jgi:transcriptional regulator GlxA family with amidase domain